MEAPDATPVEEAAPRVCLITGATSGLGLATATLLARRGATVILGCRNSVHGETVRQAIVDDSGNERVETLALDLASQRAVRQAATILRARHTRIDRLILNAAIYSPRRVITEDEQELMFAVNHLGHFLLTTLLLPLLRAAPQGRIIAVSCDALPPDLANLQAEGRRFKPARAYSGAKGCLLLWTLALAQRLEPTAVTVNAFDPGRLRTGLRRDVPIVLSLLERLAAKDPAQSAEALAHLADAGEFVGTTGALFKGLQPVGLPGFATDEQEQRAVWSVSADLAGVASGANTVAGNPGRHWR